MLITREIINQQIVYKDFNQIFPTRIYEYSQLSKKVDMFKNLLINQFDCQPGQRILIGFNAGIMQSALIFAAAELGLTIVVVDYQRNDRFQNDGILDSKTELLLPIDYFFLDIKKTWTEKINLLNKISENTIFVLNNMSNNIDITEDNIDTNFGIYTFGPDGNLKILCNPDYTPNNTVLCNQDSNFMICTSSGTTGTPKVIEHTHNFIYNLVQRNKTMYYGRVGVNANLQHGSSFATYFLPAICSESVESIYSLTGIGMQKYLQQNLDHLMFAYTPGLEAFLNFNGKKNPQLNLYTLSYIKSSWKLAIDQEKIKDVISIFGSNETSGPVFINKLSDHLFSETRYKKLDNFYNIELGSNGELSIVLPVYSDRTISTNDSFELSDDGYYIHLGRNDLIRINHLKVDTDLYKSKVSENLNGELIYDSVQQTIYLAIWENIGDLENKVLTIKNFISDYSKNIHSISKFAVLNYNDFLTGIKLDHELLRQYFRNLS